MTACHSINLLSCYDSASQHIYNSKVINTLAYAKCKILKHFSSQLLLIIDGVDDLNLFSFSNYLGY